MTDEWPDLVDGEHELTADGERLWRQAAPAHLEQDGTSDDVPEGHAYIDFRSLTKRQTNTAAELLLRRALENGWAHRAS